MKWLYEDVWQSECYSSGVLNTHAYVLTRPQGNVLFYNTGAARDLDHVEKLGGIRYQLLTHRDEVGGSLARIRDRFGSKLGIGKLEVPYVEQHSPVDIAFEPADTQLDDIRVFFTPGHTDGSICYYYESPHGASYLFSGDTFFKSCGRWSTFVIPGFGGTDADMADSLRKLRDLRPDVIMSSGFVGDVSHGEVTNAEWLEALDRHIARHARRSS